VEDVQFYFPSLLFYTSCFKKIWDDELYMYDNMDGELESFMLV
jgi:hypothetical protein